MIITISDNETVRIWEGNKYEFLNRIDRDDKGEFRSGMITWIKTAKDFLKWSKEWGDDILFNDEV